ncbi:MAG: hypothetical protein IT350_05360 [Deltaproteobacteria bacterium]|nr:hypothetical protein [Deltaproteobacteria bacterium]
MRAEFLRRLNRLFAGRFVELPFVFGDVVAFPLSECAPSEMRPLDAPRETLWTASTLPRIASAADESLRFWRGERTVTPLSESEFKNFRRNALQPILQLVPTLGAMPRFDAIVVDEAQDFLPDWWAILEDLLADKSAGKIFAFLDPRQAIFGRPSTVPAFETVFHLRHNFRNARRIAETLATLTGDAVECPLDAPWGEDVVVHLRRDPRETLRDLAELIETLTAREKITPDQIVLLTPHTRRNSVLATAESLAGLALSTDPLDRDGMLLHTTFGAFKGLESDVVILLDVYNADVRCARGARMVAASRARQLPHVFARNDWIAGEEGRTRN